MSSNEEVLNDPYTTEDQKDVARRLMALEKQAHQGALFEDWTRHQAGQMFLRYLEDQISDSKNAWLSAEDRERAEVVRLQCQVYQKIKQYIASQVAAGKVASAGIKRFQEEGVKLEGWIVDRSNPK